MRDALILPVLCLLFGVGWIERGYHAYRHAGGFAATPKNGPMTGPQAMAVGALWCACSLAWIYLAVRKRRP